MAKGTVTLMDLAPVVEFVAAVRMIIGWLPENELDLDETEDWRGSLVCVREDLLDALEKLKQDCKGG